MAEVMVTGLSGFVGSNLKAYYANHDHFSLQPLEVRGKNFFEIPQGVYGVIHLAGKAHDLKGTASAEEYFQVNTTLTKHLFDAFLRSDTNVFVFISSVKAAADHLDGILTEAFVPAPQTVYGKSKLLAEEYISSFPVQSPKRVYILRPCMIHGPGNKGNLNLLYRFAKSKLPWPLGAFQNKRSFCSIGNLLFVIDQLLKREDIPSGIYNIADDDSLSTSRIVEIIGESIGVKTRVLHLPVRLIRFLASIGNIIGGPLNTHALVKLTENYRVDNQKIKSALGFDLPVSLEDGFRKTFESFKNAK